MTVQLEHHAFTVSLVAMYMKNGVLSFKPFDLI